METNDLHTKEPKKMKARIMTTFPDKLLIIKIPASLKFELESLIRQGRLDSETIGEDILRVLEAYVDKYSIQAELSRAMERAKAEEGQ